MYKKQKENKFEKNMISMENKTKTVEGKMDTNPG